LGAFLAAGYYHFVKLFNYEDANPGQDSANGAFDAEVERSESGQLEKGQTQQRQQAPYLPENVVPGMTDRY
jgi:hypothetical protein